MTSDNPFLLVVLIAAITQISATIRYLRMAKAGATLLKQRQAGFLLTGFLLLSYTARGVSVLTSIVSNALGVSCRA